MSSSNEFWYIARAAGLTAYVLVSISVLIGLALSSKEVQGRVRAILFDAHRIAALSAFLFIVLHGAALIGDTYFDFGLREVAVPFASPYRPWQVAAGVLSAYAFGATLLSYYGRSLIGQGAWRVLHSLTLVAYAGATLHGITAGTDSGAGWTTVIYAASALAVMTGVLNAATEPVLRRVTSPALARVPAAIAAVAFSGLAVGLFLTSGGSAATLVNGP